MVRTSQIKLIMGVLGVTVCLLAFQNCGERFEGATDEDLQSLNDSEVENSALNPNLLTGYRYRFDGINTLYNGFGVCQMKDSSPSFPGLTTVGDIGFLADQLRPLYNLMYQQPQSSRYCGDQNTPVQNERAGLLQPPEGVYSFDFLAHYLNGNQSRASDSGPQIYAVHSNGKFCKVGDAGSVNVSIQALPLNNINTVLKSYKYYLANYIELAAYNNSNRYTTNCSSIGIGGGYLLGSAPSSNPESNSNANPTIENTNGQGISSFCDSGTKKCIQGKARIDGQYTIYLYDNGKNCRYDDAGESAPRNLTANLLAEIRSLTGGSETGTCQ